MASAPFDWGLMEKMLVWSCEGGRDSQLPSLDPINTELAKGGQTVCLMMHTLKKVILGARMSFSPELQELYWYNRKTFFKRNRLVFIPCHCCAASYLQ